MAAVRNGTVSETRVTDAAFRVLRTMIATGVYDDPPPGAFTVPTPPQPQISQGVRGRHQAIAARIGDATSVLLKNENGALPLSGGGSMALIGPDADYYIAGGGAGAVTVPNDVTTIFEALQSRADDDGMGVTYSAGTDSIGPGGHAARTGPRRLRRPVTERRQQRRRAARRVLRGSRLRGDAGRDPQRHPDQHPVGHRRGLLGHLTGRRASVRRSTPRASPADGPGQLTAPATGDYELSLSHLGTARLWIDGEQVIPDPRPDLRHPDGHRSLTAGEPVDVRIEYVTDAPGQFDGGLNDQPGAMMRFGWTLPDASLPPADPAGRRRSPQDADVAVVVVRDYTSEGSDRGTLTLPQDQDRLIQRRRRGQPAARSSSWRPAARSLMPWLDDVPAVVEAWYGGQTQGRTVARTALRRRQPLRQAAGDVPRHPRRRSTGSAREPVPPAQQPNPTDRYEEGVYVGYKGYDKAGLRPLFPFGHGLSYTDFRYSGLKLRSTGRGQKANVVATFRVRNAGDTAGTAVPQVYTGKLPKVTSPKRALAGFTRVQLEPGAAKTVRVRLDRRSLQSWKGGRWVTARGARTISVGESSRDIALNGRVRVR